MTGTIPLTTCPEEIRAINRRNALAAVWDSDIWDFQKQLFLSRHRVCYWCGKEAKVPHHCDDSLYGKPGYARLFFANCIPLCHRCHWAIHKGLRLCPSCKSHYIAPGKDLCRHCDPEHPQKMEELEKKKAILRKKQREYRRKQYQEMKKRWQSS